ncbi:MAG: HAMP domain-containing histidine kinase [Parasporobacterium sp.]|nr:HAMP domain-containing histidine kinase [Parasporobacterium sp.]
MRNSLHAKFMLSYVTTGVFSVIVILLVTHFFDAKYIVNHNGSLTLYILCVFVFLYVVSFFILYFIFQVLLKPIDKLSDHSKSVASGDFSVLDEYDAKAVSSSFRSLSDAINSMGMELKEKEEDERAFLKNISHDFRTPLTSIKGYVEAMADGTIPASEHEKYLRIVLKETDVLNNLAASLTDFNKWSRFDNEIDLKEFDINSIITGVIHNTEDLHSDISLNIQSDFCEEESIVYADEPKIVKVLNSLIENAIRFSPNNTEITISTRKDKDKLYISVADKGMGISEDEKDKIFDKFYKSDKSRGLEKQGIGLGLAIVKDIIIAHGETIEVESALNEGSVFTFSLKLV